MEREELDRYLAAGRSHAVVVDVARVAMADAWVRVVTLHADGRVRIEFPSVVAYMEDDSEGGFLSYLGEYASVEEAIADLERFLGRPLAAWRNYTRAPATFEHAPGLPLYPAQAPLEELVRRSRIDVPSGAVIRITGIHWRHIAKFGVFREDLAAEEQEAHFREIFGSAFDEEDESEESGAEGDGRTKAN